MKLRKILTSAVAVTACVAMLSTNVLAAVTIDTGADTTRTKLAVTIEGASGETTFLAVDAGTGLDSVTGDDIQYIDQDANLASVTFAKRASSTSKKVDIYVGNEDPGIFAPESYASKKGVYVEEVIAASTTEAITYNAKVADDFTQIPNTDLKALLNGKVKVTTNAIGTTDDEAVVTTYDSSAADSKITFGSIAADTEKKNYTIPVLLDGKAAGSITVAEVDPAKVETVEYTNSKQDGFVYFYDNATTEFTDAKAKELLQDYITATVTYDNEDEETVAGKDLTYTVSGSDVTISYGGVAATAKITVTLTQKAITDVVAPEASEVDAVEAGVKAGASVAETKTAVEAAVAKAIEDGTIAISLKYNDEAITPVKDAEVLSIVATPPVDTGSPWTVMIKHPGFTSWEGLSVDVTVTESNAMGITGKVTVADTWGATTFSGGVPVGAVITAIPALEVDGTTGNITSESAINYEGVKTAMVDENGEYTLELTPGTYNVYISHTRYVLTRRYSRDTLSIFKTILDDGNAKRSVTIEETDASYQEVNADLRYAYAGDLNLDGTLNAADNNLFGSNFNKTVPAAN